MKLLHESHCNVFKFAFGADSTLRGIGRCMRVDRAWNGVAKLMLAPILCTAKYNVMYLAVLLQYEPPWQRMARIRVKVQATSDDMFMNMVEFREVVLLQLLLQHVSATTRFQVTLRDIMNLLVASVKCGLPPDHELLLEHLYRIYAAQSKKLLPRDTWLDQNVKSSIPLLQKAYRCHMLEGLRIEMVLVLLIHVQDSSWIYHLDGT